MPMTMNREVAQYAKRPAPLIETVSAYVVGPRPGRETHRPAERPAGERM
jgi:hypothetical protein